MLDERGVHITTKEQGNRLAHAVADMVQAIGGLESVAGPGESPNGNSAAQTSTGPLAGQSA